MNPALSQEFHLFCEQEHPQRHANTDKNPYCVYGTLKENSERNLDFLSIPQSGGKMSKRLGGIIGCKEKISSWHLNGFPGDSTVTNIDWVNIMMSRRGTKVNGYYVIPVASNDHHKAPQ